MNTSNKLAIALSLLISASSFSAFTLAKPTFSSETQLPAGTWLDLSEDLCNVAQQTHHYLSQGHAYDPATIHGGTTPWLKTPPERIKETLTFICDVVNEDQQAGRVSRLTNPDFITQHFELVRWSPDQQRANQLSEGKPLLQRLPADRLLLTKYYVRLTDGQPQQTQQTPHALYGLPFDEAHLTLAEADAKRDEITRYRYGKQAIVAKETSSESSYMLNLAPSLIWLSRSDLEGALLQGTAVVDEPNGQRRYFNVHRNNGIAYDRTIRPEQQERYWYFKEVPGVLGYGKDADYKIPIKPQVTVAGDIFQLGLGRLILLRTEEHGQPVFRLTVMADTGGAFHDNLYQLDWLSGYYRDWDDYHSNNRHIGDYAEAWLLLKR
ncbi:MltA domain-containing protein [Nitrincola schmidtii]|uniref:MltA domain-containing protein n=1 Tax=Nitrincola schmidtii TaxID=1730894 RepID=UPI00124F69EB|nr:MltA domain-containing protein [Nitrincola schmidtii]